MKLSVLLEKLDHSVLSGSTDVEIRGLSFDNRKVKEGDLFVCIKGALFDTHDVIGDIISSGAAAVIVDETRAESDEIRCASSSASCIISVRDTRIAKAAVCAAWYGYPSEKMTVIGVTGSKGKTTTSHMIWSMLARAGKKTGLVSTAGGYIGDTAVHFGTSTPDSDKMQEFLARLADAGCNYAVVECSSQGLKLHRTASIDFDIGVFLNIEKGDHISPTEHKDFAEYLDCKRRLLKASRTCIVNSDDGHIDEMLQGVSGRVIRYGRGEAEHKLSDITECWRDSGPCVSFCLDGTKYVTGMPGTFNCGNAAAAVLAAKECGADERSVKEALIDIRVPGRLDMVYRSDELSVCVDYAHNGLSTRNLLKALRAYRPKRIVCVFGCGGNRDVDRRAEMGEAAGELADLSIITTEHNRYEEFSDILSGIMEGMNRTSGRYEIIEDRKEAIRHAVMGHEKGDLITILGIGNDGYQHDHGRDIPHDDIAFSREMVEEWLKSRA